MYVAPADMIDAGARIGEAVVDPAAWLRVMEDICLAVGPPAPSWCRATRGPPTFCIRLP